MRFSLFLVSFLLISYGKPVETLVGDDLVILEGATALTPGAELRDSAIVIDDDRILRIGRVGQFEYPENSTTLDLAGKWLVPGYVDTHVHLTDPESTDEVLRTLVDHGITSVRIAAGFAEANVELRDAVEDGTRFGPRMLTAGMPIDTPDGPMSWMVQVETEEEMRAEVRRQAQIGVDYIKLYRTVGPDLARAAVDEAHSLGLRVIGHLNLTPWSEASAMGMDGIVHSGVFAPTWELAPKSEWNRIRQAFNEGYAEGDEAGFRVLRESVDLDSESAHQWMDTLVANKTPLEPNLVMLVGLFWGNDDAMYRSFKPELAPASWQGTYRTNFPYTATAERTDAWVAEGRATYPLFEKIAVALFRHGAIISVGTDLMNPWMTPGTSYHRELELLVDAGLSESEVLRAATQNGAIALDMQDRIGTIAEGMEADLVILSADPRQDVSNFSAIDSVILRGEIVEPAD